MAILILLDKVEENEQLAVYKYGFGKKGKDGIAIKEVKGKVSIDKLSGYISLIEGCGGSENENDFFLDRVSQVLKRHYQSHEFPDSTYYMA